MPRSEPLTPRSAAVVVKLSSQRLPPSSSSSSLSSALIPLKPGETSLRNQKILTENEYTSSVSSIIKRDFFPHLDRLTAENEYLSALEDGDDLRIHRALRKLERFDEPHSQQHRPSDRSKRVSTTEPRQGPVKTPVYPPWDQETEWQDTPAFSTTDNFTPYSRRYPDAAATNITTLGADGPKDGQDEQTNDDENESSGILPDLSLSLDDFQAKYTSEDNASFSQLLDRENQKRKEKYIWAYQAETRENDKKRKAIEAASQEANTGKRLAITAATEQDGRLIQGKQRLLIEAAESIHPPKAADRKQESEENPPAPIEDVQALLVPEASNDDDRPASLNGWRFKARNSLMYPPDSDISTLTSRNSSLAPYHKPSSLAKSAFQQGVEPSLTRPSVNYRNTDFSTFDDSVGANHDAMSTMPDTPTSSRIDAAIRGSVTGSSVVGDIDDDGGIHLDGLADTPKVNGYGFVTPYSTPLHGQVEAEKTQHLADPTTTNAALKLYHTMRTNSTLNGNSSQHFSLAPTPRREQIAAQLSNSATQSLRTKATTVTADASPYGTASYQGLALRHSGESFLGLSSSPSRTPSGSSIPRRKTREQLTPAGRNLLDRTSTFHHRGSILSPTSTPLGTRLLSKRQTRTPFNDQIRMEKFKNHRWAS